MGSLEAPSATKLRWAWVSPRGSLLQASPGELGQGHRAKGEQRQQSKASGLLL